MPRSLFCEPETRHQVAEGRNCQELRPATRAFIQVIETRPPLLCRTSHFWIDLFFGAAKTPQCAPDT